MREAAPSVVLVCHEEDRIDREGLASWLACSLRLVGLVVLQKSPGRLLRAIRREIKRVGPGRFLDVLAFRAYYRLLLARSDAVWIAREVARLRMVYPADLSQVPRLVTMTPNTPKVQRFVEDLRPDLMIARCKFILKREIFGIPRLGTFVLHSGICPEYRNAHGCFWALANRDLARVGMTLLQVDEKVDTGAVFLQATYNLDEVRESHVVIQYRAVLENLDVIRDTLFRVSRGTAHPIATDGRRSAVWGQPWLSAYVRWKRLALKGM